MPQGSEEGKAEGEQNAGTFVPADEFKRTVEMLSGGLNDLREGIAALRADSVARGRQEPRVEEIPAEPTEEDWEAAAGDSKKLRELNQRTRLIDRMKLERDRINPLEATGTEAIGNLTRTAVLGTKEHYVRYRKEIDGMLQTMPANVRMRPDVMEFVYNGVVGQHHDELKKEERERILRGDVKPEDIPSGVGGREKNKGDAIPTVAELLGDAADHALQEQRKTPDEFARRLGHKSWAEYARMIQQQEVPAIEEPEEKGKKEERRAS